MRPTKRFVISIRSKDPEVFRKFNIQQAKDGLKKVDVWTRLCEMYGNGEINLLERKGK